MLDIPVGFIHVGKELDNEERHVFEESGKYMATFTENVRKEIHQTLTQIRKTPGPASLKIEMMGQLQGILVSLSTDLLRQEFEAKLDMIQKEVESHMMTALLALLPVGMREEVEKTMEKKLAEAHKSGD
jgi:phage-related protein